MPINIEVSTIVERPITQVFRIFAIEHVSNHPRWDPDISLEKISEGPLGLGTKIKRINKRSGKPVEGTMEVTEFEVNKKFGMYTREGNSEFNGLTLFEMLGPNQTKMTHQIEFLGLDEVMDNTTMNQLMQGAIENHKQFIEAEA